MINRIKNTLLLISFLIIINCIRHKEEPKTFEYIDYSWFHWHNNSVYSMKIYANGIIFIRQPQGIKEYITVIQDKKGAIVLSKKIEYLLNSNIDSAYNCRYDESNTFCLIIKTKNKKLKTNYHCDLFSQKKTLALDSFVYHLNSIYRINALRPKFIYKTTIFESSSGNWIPHLPTDLEQKVKFSSPKKRF